MARITKMATKKAAKLVRKPTKIFTMTVVSGDPNADLRDNEYKLRCRCWGYYFSRKTAAEAIEGNWTDMSELGYYLYGVLSELGEGPLPNQKELQWYRFNWNHDVEPNEHGVVWPELMSVTKIEKPEIYQQILFGGLS
jgi:hypothetical protein